MNASDHRNSSQIRVCHICESDGGGGAMQAAFKLHKSIERIGGDSCMIVAKRTSTDPRVIQITPHRGLARRLQRRWKAQKKYINLRRYPNSNYEMFTDGQGVLGRDLVECLPIADVYNLHWTKSLIDYPILIDYLQYLQPIVFRLPDMNLFTGGCHYTLGCNKFSDFCGSCVQLGSHSNRDWSAQILSTKERAFNRLNLATTAIVAPSRWIQGEAQRSRLLSRFRIVQISTGVDLDIFRPIEKGISRDILGLPQSKKVILFASDSIKNHRKGFDILLDVFSDIPDANQICLVALGGGYSGSFPADVKVLGRLDDPRFLALAYSAADVFVLPSRADNLPNVLIEAMACGTPSVTFKVGGIPEIVSHGETGFVADLGDSASLQRFIITILKDDDLRARMSLACRAAAESEYADFISSSKYLRLYQELIEASSRLLKKPIAAEHSA